ncbi:MAG: hypothetical protein V1646_01120 [bacterium]
MMRFRDLLRTFLVMSMFMGMAMQLSAKTHSKKTFLAPRAVGTNLPMELTTWHELSYQKLEKKHGHNIFSHLTMTPFYQASDNKDDVGEYFGIGNGKNSFVVGSVDAFNAGTADIVGTDLIHDFSNANPSLAGTVAFSPKQETWGVRFDYFQSFSHPFGGLFFKASMPVVYVENNVDMGVANSVKDEIAGEAFSIADFFAGNVEVTSDMDVNSLQSPLTHAKIAGDESKFGVADINLALGYKIHETKTDHIYLSAQIDVPTGPRPNGEYLFQPVLGNGKHFALGARLDGAVELWSNKNAAVRVLLDVDYRYLFESSENRTIGVKDLNLAHYYMAGKIGQEEAPLFPAANILTQSIRVKPGSQFDILADLSFKSGGFIIDLGYNFFYKDEEDCWMKETWTDGVYALASNDYSTNNEFGALATDVLHTLNSADLDVDALKTPSQVTNKIFAGLGYQFNYSKSVPGLVGIGGSYEFASDNAALENYSVWLKLGVSF